MKSIGRVDIDPVRVGVLVKRARTFCELRPKRDWVELGFKLSRPLADRRIARTLRSSVHRLAHCVRLRTLDDFDEQVRGWLVESYFESSE